MRNNGWGGESVQNYRKQDDIPTDGIKLQLVFKCIGLYLFPVFKSAPMSEMNTMASEKTIMAFSLQRNSDQPRGVPAS
jgi:hypothetical protein